MATHRGKSSTRRHREIRSFVTAINECLTNAIRHGGGHGGFVLIDGGALLIVEITTKPQASQRQCPKQLPAVDALDGRGLWMVQRLPKCIAAWLSGR
jgi:hypothetical protein